MTELRLDNLQVGRRKKSKRVGRGNASGRGTYSSRGLKGQRSRSGGKGGLKRKGLGQLLRSKPKLGGFKSLKKKPVAVNVGDLAKRFDDGERINPQKLLANGLIKSSRFGIKILGSGQLDKKFIVSAQAFSESAKKAILEAGGQVQLIK